MDSIRAGLTDTIEGSDYTSLQRRIESIDEPENSPTRRDAWLAPVELRERSTVPTNENSTENGNLSALRSRTGERASDMGFLPMTFAEYLQLLDWTGRQIKGGKGSIPGDQPPVLARLRISAAAWVPLATQVGRLFQRVAGAPQSVARLTSRHRFRCREAPLLSSA